MLDISGVRAGYGPFEVLHDVSVTVDDGALVALLGHNGAGKSTLLKAIAGQLPVRAGDVRFNGVPIERRDVGAAARSGIRYVPQDGNVFPSLSVLDNLRIGSYSLRGAPAAFQAHRARVYDLFPVLRDKEQAPARVLSGGQRQMLAIAMALMTSPAVLLLDEPSAGLSPINVQRVFESIARMRAEFGLSVLLVEQNVNEALRLCDAAYVMQEGRIVFYGPSSERTDIIHHLWGLQRIERALELQTDR